MARICLITDQHFGCRGDSEHFHDYFEKFYTDFFFPYLEQSGIDTIIELGDIFDRRKYVNYISLKRSKEYFFDPIKEKGIKLHCIIGNHCTYFKSTNDVNSPNLLLKEYDFNVYDSIETVNVGGRDILFVPWIHRGIVDDAVEKIKESKASIVMGHLELQGFEMYKGAVNEHGLDHKIFKKFDAVFSGHFHHKSSKDNIHYLGSPYEMTWSDYNDPRGFHVFDTATKDLTYVQNPYIMFHKIFYDDMDKTEHDILKEDHSGIENSYVKIIVKNKENPYIFDLFVDQLNKHNPAHMQVVEDHLNLDMEDDELISEAESTMDIINGYIDNLKLDSSIEIKKLFQDLYHEALSIE